MKNFLPQLAKANTHLSDMISCEEERNKVNMEHVSDEEEAHVEMVSTCTG